MIPDRLFKTLQHTCSEYGGHLNGQEIEPGYKPDYVLKRNNEFLILESENTSSRKTFVGGMMKAAHYLQGERTGKLVFVMVPKYNTTVRQITDHLGKYLNWIQGHTNLRDVYVIEASQYYNNESVIELLGSDFTQIALKV